MVSYKLVFKINTSSSGSIERYNACLDAKGFTPEYGIDYNKLLLWLLVPYSFAHYWLL